VSPVAALTLLAIIVFIALLVGYARHKRARDQQLQQVQREQYFKALGAPDWAAVREWLGMEPPPALVALYSSLGLASSRGEWAYRVAEPAEDEYRVAWLVPMHPDFRDGWHGMLEPDDDRLLAFADDGFGNSYYFKPTAGTQDPPVYLYYHDGDEHEKVCDRLSEFLAHLEPVPANRECNQ
jgi:hypothetical protein